jgi:surface polysaccharide O-acyltransferase-like enzyme
LIESLVNVALGFFITITSLYIIFPLIGLENHHDKNLILTAYLTVMSILRNYFLRRYFNRAQQMN